MYVATLSNMRPAILSASRNLAEIAQNQLRTVDLFDTIPMYVINYCRTYRGLSDVAKNNGVTPEPHAAVNRQLRRRQKVGLRRVCVCRYQYLRRRAAMLTNKTLKSRKTLKNAVTYICTYIHT